MNHLAQLGMINIILNCQKKKSQFSSISDMILGSFNHIHTQMHTNIIQVHQTCIIPRKTCQKDFSMCRKPNKKLGFCRKKIQLKKDIYILRKVVCSFCMFCSSHWNLPNHGALHHALHTIGKPLMSRGYNKVVS
jgi:hypothetical protein